MLKERVIVNTNLTNGQFYNSSNSINNSALADILKWYTLIIDANIVAVENIESDQIDKIENKSGLKVKYWGEGKERKKSVIK